MSAPGDTALRSASDDESFTIAIGNDAGWPDVRGWTRTGSPAQQIAPWGTNPLAFSAYPTYRQGVRVAVGDVNGDAKSTIVVRRK